MNHDDLMRGLMEDEEFAKGWRESQPSFAVAEMLIRLRVELELTQAQLAERAGVKREYIARLESGDANPTVKSLWRIAEGLGLELKLQVAKPRTRTGTVSDCITTYSPQALNEKRVGVPGTPPYWQGQVYWALPDPGEPIEVRSDATATRRVPLSLEAKNA